MKVTIREMGRDEPDSIVSRMREAAYPQFPEAGQTEFYEALYRWHWGHPLGAQMHRWIAVTEQGEVVGHLNALPQCYRVDGHRVVAHTPGDYMVRPGYGFHALALMRRFFRTTENFVACDQVPAVISIETRLGAEVVGELRYAAKLLNVSRLPVPPVPEPVRRAFKLPAQFAPARGYEITGQDPDSAQVAQDEPTAPLPMRPRAPIPKPAKAMINHGLRVLDETLSRGYGKDGRGRDLEVDELDDFDESFDEFFEKVAAVVPCMPEKDSMFLRWRYGPGSPQHPVKVLGVRSGRSLLGYAVLKTLYTGEDAFILDLMTLPGYREVARALLRESVRYFRGEGAHIIRYRFLGSPTSPGTGDLKRLGFFSRKGRSSWLLVRFADKGLHELGSDPGNWSYTVGDGEATFWIR